MTGFTEYRARYTNIAMERTPDGVLRIRFHSDGGPLVWCKSAHTEFEHAFREIGRDFENKVLIMSGTGDDFCGAMDVASWGLIRTDQGDTVADDPALMSADALARISWEGRQMILSLLDLEIPVIAAVNGRCTQQALIPLLSDIVLASDSAVFGDDSHLPTGAVPGDGVQILWAELLGPNRGRYAMFTHQLLDADEAFRTGVVGEVHPASELMERAEELAAMLVTKPVAVLRNTRLACIRPIRRAFDDAITHGFALETSALAANVV